MRATYKGVGKIKETVRLTKTPKESSYHPRLERAGESHHKNMEKSIAVETDRQELAKEPSLVKKTQPLPVCNPVEKKLWSKYSRITLFSSHPISSWHFPLA